MSNIDQMQSELEVCEMMTAGFAGALARFAKQIPLDKWNWSFSERTPTPREACEHAFLWMWCDRQQMTVPDRSQHRPTPELPSDRDALIGMLEEEAEEWRMMIRGLKPEQLLDERESFGGEMRNLRGFLFHIGQQVIYKTGQMSVLYYGLGLDGGEPYAAAYPNGVYGFPGPKWPAPRA
ncbi:MAG: hypothetical protein JSS72_11130 [Armatimonadetes bacterium]|nr:hypothetical protein [Armatimonadota bacterium]